uniref:Innexin n=1 Tax=Trichuris muris TaxID=70415 RepID=A0A5S6QZJ9_TRIMR
MSYLYSALGSAHLFTTKGTDDDITDQLHYRWTCTLLIILSIIVSFKQFGGRPIECMVPEMFTSAWEQYAESYCWAQDTYFIPFGEEVPQEIALREGRRISYYQWVPFFLLITAFSFQLPYFAWRFMSHRSGIRIRNIIEQVKDPKNLMPDARRFTLRLLTVHLENALKFQRRLYKRKLLPHQILRFLNLPYSSVYVTSVYILVKLLYLANVIGQFFVMNYFLEADNQGSLYGWEVFSSILNGTQWDTSGFLPRVTLCDFEVRVMGNVQRYSVQCVLVINLFNEKIFVFLWFWYHLLTLVTLFSAMYWLTLMICPCFSKWFVVRHLELADMPFDASSSRKDVIRFIDDYLRTDGVFVLRLLSMHTGVIFTSDLVGSLWRSFFGVENRMQEFGSYRWPSIAEVNWLYEKQQMESSRNEAKKPSADSDSDEGSEIRQRPPPAYRRRPTVVRSRRSSEQTKLVEDKGETKESGSPIREADTEEGNL